jgi:hypothetical protein
MVLLTIKRQHCMMSGRRQLHMLGLLRSSRRLGQYLARRCTVARYLTTMTVIVTSLVTLTDLIRRQTRRGSSSISSQTRQCLQMTGYTLESMTSSNSFLTPILISLSQPPQRTSHMVPKHQPVPVLAWSQRKHSRQALQVLLSLTPGMLMPPVRMTPHLHYSPAAK